MLEFKALRSRFGGAFRSGASAASGALHRVYNQTHLDGLQRCRPPLDAWTQFAKETLPISLEEEMRRSYLDYAMSVIVGRALPDVRDGLKPVHRRVLFAMHEANNVWNRPYVKCARVVGDVMGKYHPHGDSAIYDTLVRMAQDFSLRYTLVDGQGNFGSVDGDNAAAMRYTECRLEKIAAELLADIDKETVDFGPTTTARKKSRRCCRRAPEPADQRQAGIAVGMATNIPPHNLGEVIDACLRCCATRDRRSTS
jgi:DNA gyrase subunit A